MTRALPVVYLVRPGDSNEELRYSLRSLINLPHDGVVIVGHKPWWVTGVDHIHTPQLRRPSRLNTWRSTRHAIADLPDRFVLMNDDFFVVEPVPEIPTLHRGPIRTVVASIGVRSDYTVALARTDELLRRWGHDEPLCYEMHAPMTFDRDPLAEVLDRLAPHNAKGSLHWRSAYGNEMHLGGRQSPDCKVYRRTPLEVPDGFPFLSTSDHTFRSHSTALRARFDQPSPYELEPIEEHHMPNDRVTLTHDLGHTIEVSARRARVLARSGWRPVDDTAAETGDETVAEPAKPAKPRSTKATETVTEPAI